MKLIEPIVNQVEIRLWNPKPRCRTKRKGLPRLFNYRRITVFASQARNKRDTFELCATVMP
jgi:hypothetical protein